MFPLIIGYGEEITLKVKFIEYFIALHGVNVVLGTFPVSVFNFIFKIPHHFSEKVFGNNDYFVAIKNLC